LRGGGGDNSNLGGGPAPQDVAPIPDNLAEILAGAATNNAYTDDVIVVTGTRTGSGGDGGFGPDTGDIPGYTPEETDAPFSFGDDEEGNNNNDIDADADRRADQICHDISTQPNAGSIEYGAIIYRNPQGELVTTSLFTDNSPTTVADSLNDEARRVGLENIIGIVHNHPNGSLPSVSDQLLLDQIRSNNGNADDSLVRGYVCRGGAHPTEYT